MVTLIELNDNKGSINTQDALTYNKEFILAITIAQSMLDEISSKAYDEKIVQGKQFIPTKIFQKIKNEWIRKISFLR